MKTNVKNMVLAALFLALCLLLPFLTGSIPQIGTALSPMHIPVLICGFVCGPFYALAVGFIAPLMRNLLFGMPPFPGAYAMMFELAAYGLVSGLFYKWLPKKTVSIYISLIVAMLAGRVVWGLARYVIAGLTASEFPFSAFVAGAFTTAVPGIILHIVLIPIVIIALKKAKLMPND